MDGREPADAGVNQERQLNNEQSATCRRVLYKPTNVLVCSECGCGMPKQLDKYCYLRYCPARGRKIVEDKDAE